MSGSVLSLGRSALVLAFEGDVHRVNVHGEAHSFREGCMGGCRGPKVKVGWLSHLGWGQERLSGRGDIPSGY